MARSSAKTHNAQEEEGACSPHRLLISVHVHFLILAAICEFRYSGALELITGPGDYWL